MKKFVCLILICLMLPIASLVMAGCADKDYNIKDFYITYQNIGNNAQNLKTVAINDLTTTSSANYKIEIDYSKSTQLSKLVNNSSSQYYNLKYFYQQLLDDTLSPVYFFGDDIASSKKVGKKQTKQLFKQLKNLEQEYKDIDYYVGLLINSLNATSDSTVNLSNLKKVFVQYEQAITVASDLSNAVCNIYFTTINSNENFNYTYKTADQLNDADLTKIAIDTRDRIHYYKSMYANVYNQMYIRGGNYAESLSANASASIPSYAPYNYIKTKTTLQSKSTSALVANKTNIYNNIMSLYNIQNSIDNAYSGFNTATSKVVYSNVNSSSNADEVNYANIMSQFSNGIAVDSYEIINNLINLLYI